MQGTGHDANLAALQASARLPGHVLDIVVLTQDASLLASLRKACGPQHALRHTASADVAVDLLVGGRCCILIVDMAALRGEAAALLDRLHAQFPELVVMAAGSREEEAGIATLVGCGAVHRFLHTPVTSARASEFIAAGTRRYAQLHNLTGISLAPVRAVDPDRMRHTRVMGIAAVLAAAVLIALWLSAWHWRHELPPAAPEAPASAQQRQIADHLARAQRAYAAGRLSAPAGDNALDHFRAVLAVRPDNVRARQGVDLVVAALEARLTQALQSGNAAQGAAAFKSLQRADPQHPRLEEFRRRLLSISRRAGRHVREESG